MTEKITVITGDITKQETDAIVNAANNSLLGGGGVDGAIHHAAGAELLEECRTLKGCNTGEAKITMGYKLRAKHIIHTVGPVWKGGAHGEEYLLRACYRNSLILAVQNNIKTISFPSISTGAYRFPVNKASEAAVSETVKFTGHDSSIEKIFFVCFDNITAEFYQKALNEILNIN